MGVEVRTEKLAWSGSRRLPLAWRVDAGRSAWLAATARQGAKGPRLASSSDWVWKNLSPKSEATSQ
jgi:hypothetical protein